MRDLYFIQHVRSMDDVSHQGLITHLGRQYIDVFGTFLAELQWHVRLPSGATY